MNRELIIVIEQLAREKGIDSEILFEAVESALLSGSKKTHAAADNSRIEIDRKTGAVRAYRRKKVVADVTDAQIEISLEEAKRLNPAAEIDDELELPEKPPELGRIGAQTVKQVILQRVRDAEREGIYAEFIGKEGQILRGVVHRIEKRNVILEIGKAEAILPEREQIPGERYNPGDRIRAFVLEVRRTIKGPQIALSRTKRDVDPIGACVGLRGTRIQVISRELRGEKIDIIEWSHDPATFVARALSPAKVSSVTVREPVEGEEQPVALVIVPDNQLSLAIGKKGQNARLAAKLTGMRIDIKSESEVEAERAHAEAAEQGRQALAGLPGVDDSIMATLRDAGIASPAAVVAAGIEKLATLDAVGDRAEALYRAAAEWVAAHAPAPPDEPVEAAEPLEADVRSADEQPADAPRASASD
jgi:N utilization substance protein A